MLIDIIERIGRTKEKSMFYLILAIISSALVSIFVRLSEGKIRANVSMLAFNYMMCSVLAASAIGLGNLLPSAKGIGATLGMGTINGVFYLAGFLLLQWNVKKNGVVMSATFMKLGLLVPLVVSIFLFNEIPGISQVVGFILAIAAIIIINFEKENTTMECKAMLPVLLIVGGTGDVMAKIYEVYGNGELSGQFLFYTFIVAMVLCIGIVLLKKERPGKLEVLFGMLIGIPNFLSAKFLLQALERMAAVIVYPTYSVGAMILITLAGVGFFKEKLGRKQKVGVVVILAALVLLNL